MSDHHDDEHAREHDRPLSGPALRAKALESLLVEKGLVDPKALDELIDTYETKVGPRNGARIVARAWVDPAYRKRLLEDATAAIAEFGFIGRQGEDMVVLENTPKVRNVVVCTLCSCYPWPVLGLPPVWYKSAAYRSRAVFDPRGVLREFGLELPKHVEVRVWDSTAELRYLVLPERPAGTEGMSEEQLAALVTRNAMNGAHDLGGMHGMGPIVAERDEPVFHHEWERRVFGMTLAAGFLGKWNIDMARYAREQMPGPSYLNTTYYEHWLFGLERLLVEKGLLSPEELRTGRPQGPAPDPLRVLRARDVGKVLSEGGSARRSQGAPRRFKPGDR